MASCGSEADCEVDDVEVDESRLSIFAISRLQELDGSMGGKRAIEDETRSQDDRLTFGFPGAGSVPPNSIESTVGM